MISSKCIYGKKKPGPKRKKTNPNSQGKFGFLRVPSTPAKLGEEKPAVPKPVIAPKRSNEPKQRPTRRKYALNARLSMIALDQSFPTFLAPIMSLGAPPPKLKLGEEDTACYYFTQEMRRLTMAGRVHCTWCHIPNEGRRSQLEGYRVKAVGLIPGAPDYFFAKKDEVVFIEFKAKKGSLAPTQRIYQKWCIWLGIKYYIMKSPEEAVKLLGALGFIILEDKNQNGASSPSTSSSSS
jgi:hypothetical protein